MRRTRVNVPSCREVQKTKYGRPRGSDSVSSAEAAEFLARLEEEFPADRDEDSDA